MAEEWRRHNTSPQGPGCTVAEKVVAWLNLANWLNFGIIEEFSGFSKNP